MTAIECLKDICNRQRFYLQETSLDIIKQNLSTAVDYYLYLLTDKLEMDCISVIQINNAKEYAPVLVNTAHKKHFLFIPIHLYDSDLVIQIEVNILFISLSIYEDENIFRCDFSFNSLKGFIIWFLSNSELIDKTLFALDRIYANIVLLDHNLINKGINYDFKNVSDCKIDINKELNNFINFRQDTLMDEKRIYVVYLLPCKVKYYLHINSDNVYIDTNSGNVTASLFRFVLDDHRTLLILKNHVVTFYLLKNNEIYYSNLMDAYLLHSLLSLIKRLDIFNYLEKVNMFMDDTWESYQEDIK